MYSLYLSLHDNIHSFTPFLLVYSGHCQEEGGNIFVYFL